MSEDSIIQDMRKAGISEKKIKQELALSKEAFADFVKSPEILAMLLAKKNGVPVETPKTLGKFRSTPEKIDISEISSGMGDKNVTVSGFIVGKKKGKTKSGNPKITLTLTDGSSITRAVMFDEAYNIYKGLKFDFFDKVKLIGAKIFEFTPDKGDDTITMLTAGRFTGVEKLNKDITKVMTSYKDADVGTICITRGVVIETNENSYFGCPDCSKKGEAVDAETDFDCDCGYSGAPVEHVIVNAVVTDGEESTVVTIFPRLGILAKDIAYKPVVVVGKKGDDKLSASAIRIYDVNKKHKEFFKKDGDEETEEESDNNEETDEGVVPSAGSNAKENKNLMNKIRDSLEMFPSGIGKDGLIEIVKAKEKVKRQKIIDAIETLISKGEIEESTEDETVKLVTE